MPNKTSAVEKILFKSVWEWEHWRKGELIGKWDEPNLAVDEGITNALDVHFSVATQITDWYVSIYITDTTPVAGISYATPTFTECTSYSEANRPAWQEGGAAAKSITNSANKASFTMTTAETIYGAVLLGGGSAASTKGDIAGGGVIFSMSAFSGSKALVSSDVLKVTVTINGSDV